MTVFAARSLLLDLAERGALPDAAIRLGIRRLASQRLSTEGRGGPEVQQQRVEALLDRLRRSPVALSTDEVNRQHYEVPAEFYRLVLGPHLKYSACLWAPGVVSLDEAERRMLELTLRRARISDGEDILELGCGWGSLTLAIAERFARCRVTAISNSSSQRRFIEERCQERGLDNVDVITADVNRLDFPGDGDGVDGRRFDRIVSVEMLEHVRNHPALFERIAGWLRPGGTLFTHVFCHRRVPYLFEGTDDPGDWMARTFFTGGMMPTPELLLRFQDHLRVERQWLLSGRHYERTAEAWLENLDRRRSCVERVLADVHGDREAALWAQRWRIFLLSVAELFGSRGGEEWMICHALYRRPGGSEGR